MGRIGTGILGVVVVCALGMALATAASAAQDGNTEVVITPAGHEEFSDGTCIEWNSDVEAVAHKASGFIGKGDRLSGGSLTPVCHAPEGTACHSYGLKAGQIERYPVTAELGFINKAKGEVGIEYKPMEGGLLSRITCGEQVIETRGAAIGRFTPIDTPIKHSGHLTIQFNETEGKQEVSKFEGGPSVSLEASVNGAPFKAIGLQNTGELIPAGTLEISTKEGAPVLTSTEPETGGPEFTTKGPVGSASWPVQFTGTLGASFLEAQSGSKITCTGGSVAGAVTWVTRMQGELSTFTGCETAGFKCNTTGHAEGVIVSNALKGTLGNVTATLPGVRMYPEATGRGGELVAATCAGGAVSVTVKGSVIGTLSGASGTNAEENKLAGSTIKQTFAEAKGVQKYTKFVEGEPGTEQLETSTSGGPYEHAGQSAIVTLSTTPVKGNLGVTK